ncbi:hypothetical protein [Peribacillus butanolivorans]|uniref:hypothetical protein n=1 Tax=Peribacillus butanolivorans TaxID=421767 RepID=UPI00167FA3D1|nr:hypothetical protein [Peribacillus butanolivorans]QNU02905.1 hypothetical protein GM240_02295 [Peribacillus butanolivorans]
MIQIFVPFMLIPLSTPSSIIFLFALTCIFKVIIQMATDLWQEIQEESCTFSVAALNG